ncbi:hypothetical protein APP_13140 [Aeribacillus pallidus]|nr:hypothetical protein APP_13140 [Aeribacillus pallidus]
MKQYAYLIMFIALSVVGAFIKIPAYISSVALDSFSALVAAVVLGPVAGAVAAFFGHIMSSYLAGSPLGAFHAMIAVEMFLLVWAFGVIYRKNKYAAAVFFFIANGFLAAVPFSFLIGKGFYFGLLPGLVIGTAINLMIGHIVTIKLVPILEKQKGVHRHERRYHDSDIK